MYRDKHLPLTCFLKEFSISYKNLKLSVLKQGGNNLKYSNLGNSLVVQGLGLHAFTAKGPGLIPGRGTEIPQVVWLGLYIYIYIYIYIYVCVCVCVCVYNFELISLDDRHWRLFNWDSSWLLVYT